MLQTGPNHLAPDLEVDMDDALVLGVHDAVQRLQGRGAVVGVKQVARLASVAAARSIDGGQRYPEPGQGPLREPAQTVGTIFLQIQVYINPTYIGLRI